MNLRIISLLVVFFVGCGKEPDEYTIVINTPEEGQEETLTPLPSPTPSVCVCPKKGKKPHCCHKIDSD
jgi:hypothetical protein